MIITELNKERLDYFFQYLSKHVSENGLNGSSPFLPLTAKGRSIETMQICIDNSLCFGVFIQNKQIGFARVVTDLGQFAYIMDLFIDEKYRGKGYSKELIKHILEFDALKKVKVWRLATSDAQDLYKKFGFKPLAKPENLMELIV